MWSKPPNKHSYSHVLSNKPNGGETEGLKLLYGGNIFDMTSEGNGNHVLTVNIRTLFWKILICSEYRFKLIYSIF